MINKFHKQVTDVWNSQTFSFSAFLVAYLHQHITQLVHHLLKY